MKRQNNPGQENHEHHVRSVLKVRQLNLNNQQRQRCNAVMVSSVLLVLHLTTSELWFVRSKREYCHNCSL